jgi:hypothetical protein
LEDYLHPPSEGPKLVVAQLCYVRTVEDYLPLSRLDEPEDGPSRCGLPAAALPDKGENLAAGYIEAYPVNGPYVALFLLSERF